MSTTTSSPPLPARTRELAPRLSAQPDAAVATGAVLPNPYTDLSTSSMRTCSAFEMARERDCAWQVACCG